MKKILGESGFIVENDGKRVVVPEGNEQYLQECLNKAVAVAEKYENEENKTIETEEHSNEIIVVSEEEAKSTVEYFEKIIRDQNGNDIVVRLSIVKQSSEDSKYERLVNVSYISKVSGMLTSNQVIAYENGFQFDNDVLPAVIDGFQKNMNLSGKEVSVNPMDSTKCYLSSGDGENDIYLEGYNVDGVRSLLDYNKNYNMVGDENRQVNLSELKNDEIIEEADLGETLEEQVTDTRDELEVEDENFYANGDSYSQDGPRKRLSLGEGPNNHGLSNSVSLALFLAIDVVAIFVGLFLLLQ